MGMTPSQLTANATGKGFAPDHNVVTPIGEEKQRQSGTTGERVYRRVHYRRHLPSTVLGTGATSALCLLFRSSDVLHIQNIFRGQLEMIARFLTLLDMPAKHSVTLNLSGGIR